MRDEDDAASIRGELAHAREHPLDLAFAESLRLPAANVKCGVINIFKCWIDDSLFDPRLDFAIRSWALLSGKVRKIIQRADEERVAAICEMFQRHGYEAEDAFIRARVLYFTQIGYYALDLRESLESRLSHVPAYLRSSTGHEPNLQDVADFCLYVRQSVAQPAKRISRAHRRTHRMSSD